MRVSQYWELHNKVVMAGYADEIIWQRELKPCEDETDFFHETCWVILNSGMKEQIARKIWQRIQEAWHSDRDISSVFKHKGKVAAIEYVLKNCRALFADYLSATDKLLFLQTIPFIGKITCYHLAKNLGHDCVKPDRHLVRIANNFNTMPDALCEQLAKETGERKCVIDIVLWRAANLNFI